MLSWLFLSACKSVFARSIVHRLKKPLEFYKSFVTKQSAFKTSSVCIISSFSCWRPWPLPMISPRDPSCYLGKEAMPSSLIRPSLSTVNTLAERRIVSDQAEAIHAAAKDVSDPKRRGEPLCQHHWHGPTKSRSTLC